MIDDSYLEQTISRSPDVPERQAINWEGKTRQTWEGKTDDGSLYTIAAYKIDSQYRYRASQGGAFLGSVCDTAEQARAICERQAVAASPKP